MSQAPQAISKEQAVSIAEKDAGFLGTWVRACAGDGMWQVSAFSRSANPPVLYLIDAASGRLLYRNKNSDVPVSFIGNATTEQDETIIITDEGFKIRLDGLQRWPQKTVNKRVVVTGRLNSLEKQPAPPGDCVARLTFKGAKWKLAK
ncbi:MAG TPA: PepSY domain-containing protein, partial [Candidatus Angelobacter sp.]|nr:PepSY domain-containing protein [Candidatus Angelobacter sp.]